MVSGQRWLPPYHRAQLSQHMAGGLDPTDATIAGGPTAITVTEARARASASTDFPFRFLEEFRGLER